MGGRKAALARMAGLHLMLIFTIAASMIPGSKARPAVQRRIDDVSSLAQLVSALIWDELLEQEEELRAVQLQTPLDGCLKTGQRFSTGFTRDKASYGRIETMASRVILYRIPEQGENNEIMLWGCFFTGELSWISHPSCILILG